MALISRWLYSEVGGDWLLVKGFATFFWKGALIPFRPEPGFFLWGLLFVGQSRLLVYPKGRVFQIVPISIIPIGTKINLPKCLEFSFILLTFNMWLRDNKPSLPPLYIMKTPKITKKELIAIAPTINAAEFEALCEKNGIHTGWLDVSVEDYNREYYNVEVDEFGLFVAYYDGVLEEIYDL